MHRDWDKFNPEREPVVEIYQDRRGNYEYLDAPQHPGAGCPEQGIEARTASGFVVEALRRGYKPGFCSGGDHHGIIHDWNQHSPTQPGRAVSSIYLAQLLRSQQARR